MAARINPRHSDEIRAKIQAGVLIDRLHKHAVGKLKMTATQIKAADILLERSVPKLSQIQMDTNIKGKVELEHSVRPQLSKKEWLKLHGMKSD